MKFNELVSIIRKDMWDAKANYVSNLMEHNSQIGTLTQEQHDVLSWLCRIRHEIHSDKHALWNTESGNHDTYWHYLTDEIPERLRQVGLPEINLNITDEDYITTDTWDLDFEDSYEAESTLYSKIEECNTVIEDYLRRIDDAHGTQYCPTGYARVNW